MEANRRADMEEMNANNKRMLAEMQDKMEANMGSIRDELKSTIKNFKFDGEETTACQETMEARLEGKEEPASEEMKPEVAHQEVPWEDAKEMPVGEPRKRRRNG
jgi:hypothetical protein